MKRSKFREFLVARIADLVCEHPIRVGIDGIDGVGKSRLAEELIVPLERCGRPVIRASIDGFHNPRTVRYRRGRDSPEGYFRDSFNYTALVSALLAPLGPGGSRRYRCAVFDYRMDAEIESPLAEADSTAVLLFDGVFLHHPELRPYWDFSILLEAPFEVTARRLAHRAGEGNGDGWQPRYVEGQKLYFHECDPHKQADIVVEYQDLERPAIVMTR